MHRESFKAFPFFWYLFFGEVKLLLVFSFEYYIAAISLSEIGSFGH